MMHFRDYDEYQRFRQEMGIAEDRSGERPKSELVMEDNTIYEIDTACEKCLKRFWEENARKKEKNR